MLRYNYQSSDFSGIYDTAFSADFNAIWMGTPFKNEVSDLSYIRTATCFLQSTENSEIDRRRILYYYLSNIFSTEVGKPLHRNKQILKTDNQIVNRIINNICSLYNEEPVRSYLKDGKDYDAEELINIFKKAKLNRILKQGYKLAKLVNEVAVRPYIDHNLKLQFQILTPDLYRTLKNENNEVTQIWIPFQTYDKWMNIVNRIHVWDSEKYLRLDGESRAVSFEMDGKKYGAEGYFHGYGKIPFQILKMNENEIYGGGLWELVKTQIYCNAVDYLAQENLLYGGIGLWFLQNLGIKGDVNLNPGEALIAENVSIDDAQPDARFIQGSPIYNDIADFKQIIIKDTLKAMGMPSGMLSDNPGLQSGISMKIDRMELNEYRRDDIDVLQEFEQDLINLTLTVMNTDLKTSYPTLEINTDYIEQQIYLEPQIELEYVQALYDKGLISPKEYLHRLTGNVLIKTDEDAIKFINDNKAFHENDNGSTGDSGQIEQVQSETKVETSGGFVETGTTKKSDFGAKDFGN